MTIKNENTVNRWLPPVALVLAACAALAIDTTVAHWSLEDSPLRFLRDVPRLAEVFGHGIGVALIAGAVWTLDPPRRRALGWLLAGSWGAGLAANLGKLAVARLRPHHWLDGPTAASGVFDTFVAWCPLGRGGSGQESFPSAHMATAVGLALVLSALYPRGRWYFAVLAVLVGLQRIASHAHFPSDVLMGAAIGWIVGQWCAARALRQRS